MYEINEPNPQPGLMQNDRFNWAVSLHEWLRRIFKCWHRQLSMPFTADGETYRVCLYCGARRRFNPESWRTVGNFYRNSDDKTGRSRSRRGRSQ